MSQGEELCSGWGKWQLRLALLLALPVLLTGAYGTNYVFLAAPTSYRCLVPECEGNSSYVISNQSDWSPEWSKFALSDSSCKRFQPLDGACSPDSFDNISLVNCEQFVYEPSSSIVVEFDLACAEWKRSLVGTIHNVGMLMSMSLIGFISDRWGRRSALMVSGCGAGIFGLLKSFTNSYEMYVSGELVETIFGASVYPAAFVLMIEWLGVKHRILASLVLGIPLALGSALLSLLDYLTGYWRLWARIAYPPSFILLVYPWILPESVRWLIAQGRFQEAIKTIKKAAECNKTPVSEESLEALLKIEKEKLAKSHLKPEEGLFKALLKYNTLRIRLCICFVWWFSAVFVFYGLAVNAHGVGSSLHVQYALLAAAQLPALILNTLLLDRVGRRPLLTAALLLTASTLIALSCLNSSRSITGIILYLAGEIGATMTLNALYVYTAELFPTPARHRLLAACSTMGRVGSILAPLTPLLAVYAWWIPTALFGALPLISAALTRLVPDTLHCQLPSTFAELESMSSNTDLQP